MMLCRDLGIIDYNEAWSIQERLKDEREKGAIPDTLLLLEHPPVFTLGKRDCLCDIVSNPDEISKDGIEVIKTNRGGRVTYHGPGQLVGYFICSIGDVGVKKFVFQIEELLIRVLADYNVKGERDPKYPGIFVGKNKIAAVGLHVSKGITQHGFALNVNANLDHYRHIIPCGIMDRGVTSLDVLLGRSVNMDEVKQAFRRSVSLLKK
jgi:lipoyl(octanoyl) transferase